MKLKAKSHHPVQLWFSIFTRWCSPNLVWHQCCVGWMGYKTLTQPTYGTRGGGGGQSMHFGTSRFGVGALKMVPISTVASYNEIAKLYSSVFPSLGKVLAGSSLFNSFFKFSKWVSFTCSLGAFQSVAFAPDLRASFFVAGTLSAGALFHTFLSFSWSESPLIFKTICFVGLSFHLDKIIMVFI